jgi:hypothetical protein
MGTGCGHEGLRRGQLPARPTYTLIHLHLVEGTFLNCFSISEISC